MAREDEDTLPSAGPPGPSDPAPGVLIECAAPALAPLPRGARVGDYLIEAPLDAGGFSVIYRAAHAATGAPAAVKVLHPELSAQPEVVARFQREVETVRRLRHPGIVEVFEQGRLADGRPYYIMELLTGVSLDQDLRARGRLPPEEALAILDPLCDALGAAHAQSIVHRDLKPSNIFLAGEGRARRVVLLDFGIAKLLDAPGPALTSSRQILGSISCIAPEQLLGQAVDARTDVYALGALTYRMLVGEPPFAGDSGAIVRQMHLFASPPRPSARARFSPAFDEVILRALGKDRAARHPSIADFLADFRRALEASRAPAAAPPGAHAAHAARVRKALAVYAEVGAADDALDAPDDSLLADLEAVLPFVAAELTAAGLSLASETGSSLLFLGERPDDPAADAEARRRAVDAALAIFGRLAGRPGRDPRVHVRLSVHAGELLTGPAGELLGGAIMEVAGWAPEGTDEAVFASPEALAGLGVAAGPPAGALLRIAGAATTPSP